MLQQQLLWLGTCCFLCNACIPVALLVCSGCFQLGLHHETETLLLPVLPCHPVPQDIRQDYEGGYVLIAVEHADAPASDWHRDDLFAGSS